MARDNRKDNRDKAKTAAGNENTPKPGSEFADMTDEFSTDLEGVEEEDISEIENKANSEADDGDGNTDDPDNVVDEDVAKREAEAAKAAANADTKVIDKPMEEEGKSAEELAAAEKAKKEAEAGETPEAKALREAEEAKAKTEPGTKPEPTAEEKKKAEDEAKAATEAEAAKKKAEKEKEDSTLTDEEAAKLFGDWRNTTETLLAEHHYKLTEEDVAQLNENPAAYIPRAMSRVYLDCISASFQQFVQYLPRMVHQVLEARDVNSKNETDFFAAWPDLAKHEKGRDTVLRLGAAYRQANPAASVEDWINEVGAQSMVALRITPSNAKIEDPAKKETAFKPASNTPASVPQKPLNTNPYAQLAEEFGAETAEEVDDS